MNDTRRDLLDMSPEELERAFEDAGLEKYRARQVFQWVSRGLKDLDGMTDISKALRERLKESFYIGGADIESKLISKEDETVKYLLRLGDGNMIESVLMKYHHGYTACISSQAGCRMGCRFCASTGAGFSRDLTAGEMLGQVLTLQGDAGVKIGHVVIMGIGEPLDNFSNAVKFLRILNHPWGLNIGLRHVALSTCGLVPEILKLAELGMPITLSISLHAPNDAIRKSLMPVGNKYSIDKIIEACKIYTEVTKRRVTFEYAMISGLNDSRANAEELAGRIKGLLCHVNLIPVNRVEGTGFKKSYRRQLEDFKAVLEKYGIQTTIRRELGQDINAACGQLRRSAANK